jgi:esterase/lipase superfamily enzyme
MLRKTAILSLALTLTFASLAIGAEEPGTAGGNARLRRPLSSAQLQAAPRTEFAAETEAPSEPREPNCAFDKTLGDQSGQRRPMVERTPIQVAAKPRSEQPNHASVLRDLSARAPFDVSASGRYMVAVDSAGGLVVIDAMKVARLHSLQNSRRAYSLVEISPDARWIAAVRTENPDEIDLWRADNGRFLRTIISEGGAKKSLDFDAETRDLRVADRRGNGQLFSVPAGILTGSFQSSNGLAAVSPPKVSLSIEAPQTNPQPSVAATSPAPQTSRPRVGGSRVGGPRPNPIRDAAPREPIASAAARPAPSGGAAPMAPAEAQKHLAEVIAPQTARLMAQPMMAEPMMAEPMMAQPQQFDAAEYEPAVAAPMAAAPPEPTPAAAPAPTPAAAPAAAAPSNPFGALARLAPAETSEAFVPDMESRGNAADALPPDVASAATAPQPASASPQSIAELASEKTPPPPAEDLTSIMVHYATNRQRLTAEDRQFSVYFQGFFFSLPAVVLYALILLALVVFPMLGRRAWAAAAVVTGIALLVSMASIEAYVRSQLRDELSGELYGSVPTNLNYGKCKISVPKPENRVAGELNRPLSVWVLQAPENPEKHFTLEQVTEHADKDEFYTSLSQQLANSEDGTSLLFIHGYNVSFEDALFRTAQLAVDLKFHGAPISFSWPSYADPVKYTFDEQNAEVSIPALREFLEDLATRSGAKRIHIVAHSMGNRVLAGALRAMSPDARQRNKAMFREIVLAAPDIDSRVFQSQVLPHIQENTEHCTLYASSNDRALMLSRYFHNYQRLGETEPELIVATGMDTIDASLVDTSLLGHSYIGDVQSIVSDLHELVVVGKRPTERIWLEAELLGELMYWAIRPDVQTASEQKTNR